MTASLAYQGSSAWLEARKAGLGGSDAPAVAGLSPYRSAFDVWSDKTGQATPADETARMQRGHLLEDACLRWYAAETGNRVQRVHRLLHHREHTEMLASLDGRVVGQPRIVEVKTTTRRVDEVPADWQCQVQHYLAVTGAQVADVVALTGGLEFKRFEVPRDEGFIDDLVAIEHDFWTRYVLTQTPPPIDGSDGAKRFLAARYPVDDGLELVADADVAEAVRAYLDVGARIDAFEHTQNALANAIKDRMGEHTALLGPDFRVTWKRTADVTTVDWQAVAAALAPPPDLVETHTHVRPGTRRFVVREGGRRDD